VDAADDFATLTRQYWSMWGDALRETASKQGAGVELGRWFDAWRLQMPEQGTAGDALGQFHRQAQAWLTQMSQLALQFAGREHTASDVVQAWRALLGDNPLQALLQGMPGMGQWLTAQGATALPAVPPWLEAWLSTPAFGVTREHQERLQALARAQLRCQQAQQAWTALLAKMSQEAFTRFENWLSEYEASGQKIERLRALFDLWVDAAEDAWAQAALSQEFRQVLGELTNAQVQWRSALQAIADASASTLGLPSRADLESTWRKLADMQRQLRSMASAPVSPEGQSRTRSSTPRQSGSGKPRKTDASETQPEAVPPSRVARKRASAARPSARPSKRKR